MPAHHPNLIKKSRGDDLNLKLRKKERNYETKSNFLESKENTGYCTKDSFVGEVGGWLTTMY